MTRTKFTVLHNPHDRYSVDFIKYLDKKGMKYCRIDWYGSSEEEALRLLDMITSGALDGTASIPPEIKYTDQDIKDKNYPDVFSSWVRKCECHKGEPYEGPPPRSFPSWIEELDNGELGLWDLLQERDRGEVEDVSPEQMFINITPEKMVCSVKPGECIAGQWWEGAMETAKSPYWSNNIIRTAVKNFQQKYYTLKIPQEKDKILAGRTKRKVKHVTYRSL